MIVIILLPPIDVLLNIIPMNSEIPVIPDNVIVKGILPDLYRRIL